MNTTTNYNRAKLIKVTLAQVGNSLRSEPLRTSNELSRFSDNDTTILTHSFLKPFKNLESRALISQNTSLDLNEIYRYTTEIFKGPEALLSYGRKIARHLYKTSIHPNIKSGDLCMALIDDVLVDGEPMQALSIIKSESRTPFLEVTDDDGSLQLITHRGILPDNIDKGCLIINHDKEGGYLVYTFDKSSRNSLFWIRDFLGVKYRKTNNYATKRYAELAVSFIKEGLPEETPAEDRCQIAYRADDYLEGRDNFDLKDFSKEVLQEADLIEKFDDFYRNAGDEYGELLPDAFEIDKKTARKSTRKLKLTVKLDNGVDISFTPYFRDAHPSTIERGFDDGKQQKFIKIYYEEEL